MTVLLEAMKEMGISLGKESNETHSKLIFDLDTTIEEDNMPKNITVALVSLWADEGVRGCLMRSNEFQLNDSAE
jgi:guanine nucleotide-binding protein G(i) subunit alpha